MPAPPPDFDDDLTPTLDVPAVADVPMEIAKMKLSLYQQARAIGLLKKEREETKKGLQRIWMSILAGSVALALATVGALLQMGAYMERIDNVAAGQQRILSRLDNLDRH